MKKRNFGGSEILFRTKKDAINALSEAYQHLKSDKEDWKNAQGSYCRADSISYDASRAVLSTNS